VSAHPRGLAHHVEACDLGAPAVGLQQRGQDPHGGGLPGAVGAEQPQHGAGRYGQVEPVERGGLAVALPEPLGEDRVVVRVHVHPLTRYTVRR
jgi:hypothetical protein